MLDTLPTTMLALLPLLLLAGAFPWPARWTVAFRLNALTAVLALTAAALPLVLPLAGAPMDRAVSGVLAHTGPAHALSVLVAFLGTVIVGFSRAHLRGEVRRDSYLAMLQLTLAAVMVVVLADHLLLLLVGWIAISLGLHRLLLFYPDRPRAALAAHKKFLLARAAELCLFGAVLLLYAEHETWRISEIMTAYATAAPGPLAQVAAALLAAAALIKCAQLPVHGWLIQVVEAPTPVSALLHAGIINLGGFLLIVFAPLFSQVPAAQWLVLVVAGLTTVLAALVMYAQTSVKVRLAWSTSAQMGLMLVECALGLYELALLHLLAHACYKAHGFLGSGQAVEAYVLRSHAPRRVPGNRTWLLALAVALPLVALAALLVGGDGPISPWVLLAALLTFFLVERPGRAVLVAPVMLAAYLVQKLAIAELLPAVAWAAPVGADAWVASLVLLLSASFWLLRERPDNSLSRRLDVPLLAGFYLDEWFTRTTLAIWPVRLPPPARRKQSPDRPGEVY